MKRIGWFVGLLSLVLVPLFVVHAQTSASTLNAQCVGDVQVITSYIKTGIPFEAIVKVKNTGNVDWKTTNGFKLGSANPQDNVTWGKNRVNLPGTVKTGSTATFVFVATPPTIAGSYPFSWQMTQEGKSWFGAVCSTNNPIVVHQADNKALGKSIDMPNDIFAGQQFSATVTMKNIGYGAWVASDANEYGIQSRVPKNNLVWGIKYAKLEANTDPGQLAVFHVGLTAPTKPGTYTLAWRMVQHGKDFGTTAIKTVVVKKAPVPISMFSCGPRNQTAIVGQPVTVFEDPFEGLFSANWLAPDGTPTAGTGTSFTTTFTTVGTKTIAARSINFPNGEKQDFCTVTVTSGTVTPTPTPTPTQTPTTSVNPLGCEQLEHHPAVGDAIHFRCTDIAGVEYLRWSAIGATPASEQSILTSPTVTFTTTFNTPGLHDVVMRYSKKGVMSVYTFAQNILPKVATPTPTPSPSEIATKLICSGPDGVVTIPNNNQFKFTLSTNDGVPVKGQSIVLTTDKAESGFFLIQHYAFTDANGAVTAGYANHYLYSGPAEIHTITANFSGSGTLSGGSPRYSSSSCNVSFNVITPTPTPVPNSYDGQTPTPTSNGYDGQTVTPNPYTNPYTNPIVTALTAIFTSPVANTKFTKGQNIPVAVSGNGTPTCGTWTLTKPNGQTVTLTAADFENGKLPGNIPNCDSDAYNPSPHAY